MSDPTQKPVVPIVSVQSTADAFMKEAKAVDPATVDAIDKRLTDVESTLSSKLTKFIAVGGTAGYVGVIVEVLRLLRVIK